MDNIDYELSNLALARLNEIKAVQKKLSLADIVESLLAMNEALKQIIFEENTLDFSAIFTKGSDGKTYSKSDEVRLKAIDQFRKNLDFICKLTSIPLQLLNTQGKDKGGSVIETITPLALPPSDD